MSQLSQLIAAVVAARNEPISFERDVQDATYALADYCIAHVAEYAERERLEAAAIDALKHWRLSDITNKEFNLVAFKLVQWLVAHADADGAT